MRWWPLLLSLALSGCVTFWTGDIDPVPAPEFQATDVDGRVWNRTDVTGPLLIDFMGTWCTPCQRAVPVLRDLQQAYPDLTVFSVSSTDTPEKVQDFRGHYGADWPHFVDDGTIVDAYREAGSSAPDMMWPSYALVVNGELVFYNRGETLPATFAAAIDRQVHREAPAVGAGVLGAALPALVLGAAAWLSPWLVGHVRESDPRRPAASAALPLLLFGALGLAAAYGSRPLSGRVGTLAPFLAVAGVVMVVYWRWKGDVTAQGKKVQATGWRHAWALHGDLLWYGLPVWGAVLHAALLRTAPMEALVMLLAFGLGAAVMDVAARGPAGPVLRRLGDRAGWVGAAALLAGAAWNGLLYLR